MTEGTSARVGGSFRDPSGYVFRRSGRIFRAVDESFQATFRELERSGLLSELVESGSMISTTEVGDAALASALQREHRGRAGFLEHRLVDPITYPYEWCFSMLAEAGIHTLDLQLKLIDSGYSLKDASAFNVQFVAGRPVFIDLTSIERPRRLDLWYALGQFGQMFTLPLSLTLRHGWDLKSYFMASLGGRSLEQVARGLPWLSRLSPALLLDLTLPLWLGRMAERRPGRPGVLAPAGARGAAAQRANLTRLRRKLASLAARYRPRGVWAAYAGTCSYDKEAEAAKKNLVRGFLERTRPARVLDVGCNTGDYSFLAAATGAKVVAVDADHDAIELLYRRLQREQADIAPVVANLADPSPALGFRNEEREALLPRVRSDSILALALLHHLLVTANLDLAAVRDLFCELTRDSLVLEFVPPDDPMFERLVRFRTDRFGHVTLALCRSVFAERFEVERKEAVPGSRRTILFLRKRHD